MRILFLICTFLSTCLSAQVQYYVSLSGNNSNVGSLLQPWQSIQFAIDNSIPGCTINVMGGVYSENVVVSVSGTAGNPITIKNYNNQAAVLTGLFSSGLPLLYISNQNYIIINGLEFTNYVQNDAQGILVDGVCDHVEIRNTKIHDIHFSSNPNDVPNANTNSQPLIVYGDDANTAITNLIISGNEIYNCRTGYSEALAVNGNVDGFEISGNRIHNNSNIGIDVIGHEGTCPNPANDQARNGIVKWNKTWSNVSIYTTSAGIYVDGGKDCILENNICYDNGSGIEVGCEAVGQSTSNITVRNNLVYWNQEGGIVIGGYDYPTNSGKVDHCFVCGNTIVNNINSPLTIQELIINYTEFVTFRNNLIYTDYNNGLIYSSSNSQSLSFDFNLYYSPFFGFIYNSVPIYTLQAWQAAIGGDNSSLFTDPLFVSIATNNYHLNSNSPAIDMGDSTYTAASGETDIDTMNRVQNGRVDIGADEYGTAVGISDFQNLQNNFLYYENSGSELIIHFIKPQAENSIIYLYDAAGKLIEYKEIKMGDSSIIFNSTKLSKGIYIANVNGNTMKIMK